MLKSLLQHTYMAQRVISLFRIFMVLMIFMYIKIMLKGILKKEQSVTALKKK